MSSKNLNADTIWSAHLGCYDAFDRFEVQAHALGEHMEITENSLEQPEVLKEAMMRLCGMFLEMKDAQVQQMAIIQYLTESLEVDAGIIQGLNDRIKVLEASLEHCEVSPKGTAKQRGSRATKPKNTKKPREN